jgi:hypothetical protein
MKSLKPSDPRRLTITGFGKPKARKGVIQVLVQVEYEPWCCTNAHEYVNAFTTISNLFEDTTESTDRRDYVASQLEMLADRIYTDTLDKDQAIELLNSVAQYLKDGAEEH